MGRVVLVPSFSPNWHWNRQQQPRQTLSMFKLCPVTQHQPFSPHTSTNKAPSLLYCCTDKQSSHYGGLGLIYASLLAGNPQTYPDQKLVWLLRFQVFSVSACLITGFFHCLWGAALGVMSSSFAFAINCGLYLRFGILARNVKEKCACPVIFEDFFFFCSKHATPSSRHVAPLLEGWPSIVNSKARRLNL